MKGKLTGYSFLKSTAQIITPPSKIEYTQGEYFNPSGMIVSWNDKSGAYYTIDSFDLSSEELNPLIAGDTEYSFYITVGDDAVKLTQAITVAEGPTPTYNVVAGIHSSCSTMFNSVTGSRTSTAGTTATFQANLKEGYEFIGWYDSNDNLISTSNPYSFIISKNVTYFAKGKESVTPIYTVNVSAASGCESMFSNVIANPTSGVAGTSVTLAATVNDGYEFTGWYEDETLISTVNPYTFNLSKNVIYKAKGQTTSTDPDYLCFTALEENSSVKPTIVGTLSKIPELEYSFDKENWTNVTYGVSIPLTNINDKVYFRGDNDTFSEEARVNFNCVKFLGEGKLKISGILNSLISKQCDLDATAMFSCLFEDNTALIDASELCLSRRTTYECFAKMFWGCINLQYPPIITTTGLIANKAYLYTFGSCRKLHNTAWEFSCDYIEKTCNCYEGIFQGIGLPSAPITNMIITVNFDTWDINHATLNWLKNSRTADCIFRCPRALPIIYGDSYIPEGWTVEYID